jgi:O-antigen/teichoic acid export membrane protein
MRYVMTTQTLSRNAGTKITLDRIWKDMWRGSTGVRKLYGTTVLTEATILASQLIAYKLAASYLGKEGFSEYALARRTISLLQPAAILGLNVAIPRYVAFAMGRKTGSVQDNYFAAGLLIVASALAVCVTLLNLLKGPAAFLFFGSAAYQALIPAIGLFLAGLALHMACEGYFRGSLDMTRANLLRFINLGIIPIIVFPLVGSSAEGVLTALGAAMGITSAVALLVTGFGSGTSELLSKVRELLLYGLGRVPADLLQLAFLSLPSILLAHFQGLQTAGLVAFSTSVLTMLCSLFLPVSSVLLPESSRMISRGDLVGLQRRVSQILIVTLVTVTLSVAAIELFARPIFRFYLGHSFDEAVGIVRIVVLGAAPYALYVGLRSVIDASSVVPINAKNMLISFGVFLAGSSAVYLKSFTPACILVTFAVALYILGGLTLLEVKKICWGPNVPFAVSAQARLENIGTANNAV